MQHTREEKMEAFGRVMDILARLRKDCPWDRVQTNDSLRPNTIEEVYELCDALLNDDNPNIRKELGDVLLHVLFYALIGEEKGAFDIADVCDALNEKLVYRHPHVFGSEQADSAGQVLQNWEQLKLSEKGGNKTVLGGVPEALPPLIKAYRMQEKAAHVGFDWEEREQVWDKVHEEMAEFKAEAEAGRRDGMEAEMGDLIFSVVNLARLYDIHPDTALERTNKKFRRRFNHIEEAAAASGRSIKDMTLAEMEALWQEAKNSERTR